MTIAGKTVCPDCENRMEMGAGALGHIELGLK